MGILKEMFSEDSYDDYNVKREPVFLARGKYRTSAQTVLNGYKVFRRKYVWKGFVFRMILLAFAFASAVLMLINNDDGSNLPVFMFMICIAVGIYFISQPINNMKKLKSGLEIMEGTEYEAEFTDMTIKIISLENGDNNDILEKTDNTDNTDSTDNTENKEDNAENTDDGPPATIIHIDSYIVDIFDKDDMFIVCVKKAYVFIIPKSAFTEDEVQKIREKYASVMGIRFKILD